MKVFYKGNLFYVCFLFPQGPYENTRLERRMNIWFVGRCLSWLRAAHSFSLTPYTPCEWTYYFQLLSILLMSLWLRFSIYYYQRIGGHRESLGWQTVGIPSCLTELHGIEMYYFHGEGYWERQVVIQTPSYFNFLFPRVKYMDKQYRANG